MVSGNLIYNSAFFIMYLLLKEEEKLRVFSSPANYTDRATAACRRS
jgi:hypothetical protein